jgi:hypothetical protein
LPETICFERTEAETLYSLDIYSAIKTKQKTKNKQTNKQTNKLENTSRRSKGT